jgi:hypothetical protein
MKTQIHVARCILGWTLGVGLALTPSGAAGTIYVHGTEGNDAWDGLCATWNGGTCGPKRTIQAGIDVAVAGDEVSLAPVTYTGDGNRDVDFLGKAITVRSENPFDPNVVAATVVDCQANEENRHRAFNFVRAEGRSSVLAGLTIRGGCAPWTWWPGQFSGGGGAVLCVRTSPTLRSCAFLENQANWGGAVASYGGYPDPYAGGSPRIVQCVFRANGNSLPFSSGTGNAADFSGGAPVVEKTQFLENTGGIGGALAFTYSAAVVSDCVFRDNQVPDAWLGGGLAVYGGDLAAAGCEFVHNTADDYPLAYGGGVCVQGPAQVKLWDCRIRNNIAGLSYNGGGLGGGAYFENAQVTMVGCVVTGNSGVGVDSVGGAICADGNSVISLVNCAIAGNQAVSAGGAICAAGNSVISLVNCAIAGNQAVYGGALACVTLNGQPAWSELSVTNCTFTGNRASTGAALAWQLGSASISNSIIWNGLDWLGSDITGALQYSNVEGGWPDVGDIDADPLFADPGYWNKNETPEDPTDDFWIDGDYRLRPGSPCIDAGNSDAVPADVTADLAGNPRFADDPATPDTGFGTAPLVDMGAYEYMPLGDVNCDGVVNFDDINAFMLALSDPAAYAAAFPSCDRLKADCNADGVVDFDDIDPFVALLSGD